MFHDKCPACGTKGRVWNDDPEVFICPNCSAYFSKFGILADMGNDADTDNLQVA